MRNANDRLAGGDDLSDLGLDRRHHAGGIGTHDLKVDGIAGLAQLGLRGIQARDRGVEGGLLAIERALTDVVLTFEAAQTVELDRRQIAIGAGRLE